MKQTEVEGETAAMSEPIEKYYRLYISEVDEDGERVRASRILQEIHDAMCMCGVEPQRCDTEGIAGTCLEAAHSLLATGKWSTSFEDGWMKVETI